MSVNHALDDGDMSDVANLAEQENISELGATSDYYAPPSASTPRDMPRDFSIAIRRGNGADTSAPTSAISTSPVRRQSMRGFEAQYTDIVDYIVRITHRIWEDQDIGYIYDTYAPGCRLHTDSGLQYGVEPLVESTIESIHAFPDTRSYADDVIWAGNDTQGFVTSHRAINIGHHVGPWRWGQPTGKKFDTWVIANCLVVENEIVEEWVLYNTAARLALLGIDVVEAARAYGNEGAAGVRSERDRTEVDRLLGGRKPMPYPELDPAKFNVEHFVRALWHNMFNRRDLSAIDRAYAQSVLWNGTTNRVGRSREDVRAYVRSLLATFPDLGVAVEDVYWMGNDADGYRVSLRWSGSGTHRGHALYGRPTNRRAHLWGIAQLYIHNGAIVEEWNLFNEFDVLAQLVCDETPSAGG